VMGTGVAGGGETVELWRAGAFAGSPPDYDIGTTTAIVTDAGHPLVMARVSDGTPVAAMRSGSLDVAGERVSFEVEED
jgi:hypothetical protein